MIPGFCGVESVGSGAVGKREASEAGRAAIRVDSGAGRLE